MRCEVKVHTVTPPKVERTNKGGQEFKSLFFFLCENLKNVCPWQPRDSPYFRAPEKVSHEKILNTTFFALGGGDVREKKRTRQRVNVTNNQITTQELKGQRENKNKIPKIFAANIQKSSNPSLSLKDQPETLDEVFKQNPRGGSNTNRVTRM